MTNLPAKREDISPFIRGTDIELVQAYYGCALTKIAEADAIKKILQVLNKALVELGIKATGNTREEKKKYLVLTAKLILNDTKLYFPNVTVEEIQLAVARGIRNEYGEYFGLNVISVHKFIEGYIRSEARNTALERQRRFVESQKPKPRLSDEEIARIMAEGFEERRKEYKKNKCIVDYNNVNYDYAVEKGLIKLTREEKWELYHLAEKIVAQEILQEEQSIHHLLSRKFRETDDVPRIVRKAKDLALKRYFDSI